MSDERKGRLRIAGRAMTGTDIERAARRLGELRGLPGTDSPVVREAQVRRLRDEVHQILSAIFSTDIVLEEGGTE